MTVKLFMIPADVVAALPQYLLPSLRPYLRNNNYVIHVLRYDTLYVINQTHTFTAEFHKKSIVKYIITNYFAR